MSTITKAWLTRLSKISLKKKETLALVTSPVDLNLSLTMLEGKEFNDVD